MGGERATVRASEASTGGSSPRGRGTRWRSSQAGSRYRIIPAWAGNAGPGATWRIRPTDHPRVGGERSPCTSKPFCPTGSSPRGRGTPTNGVSDRLGNRIIPAWAGNAKPARERRMSISDHPRVGGERSGSMISSGRSRGSSPRGRGTRRRSHRGRDHRRIIPAWAGNARKSTAPGGSSPDHPRVGGERISITSVTFGNDGSSPRGRGTRLAHGGRRPRIRIIPAWAGNAASGSRRSGRPSDHPRVGGERTLLCYDSGCHGGSSPRGRGTHGNQIRVGHFQRIIPAWAGNASTTARSRRPATDHPRVGGERFTARQSSACFSGSSPRGRGTRPRARSRGPRRRIIPAWAGNALAATA